MAIQLSEMLFNLYGVRSHAKVNPVTDNIDSTVTNILKNNPNRLSFLVINLGAVPVYILPANTVSTSKGIYLASNGGSAVLQWDRDFELVAMAWYGIASQDNVEVLVLENISI